MKVAKVVAPMKVAKVVAPMKVAKGVAPMEVAKVVAPMKVAKEVAPKETVEVAPMEVAKVVAPKKKKARDPSKPLSASQLVDTVAEAWSLSRADCKKALEQFTNIAIQEVKTTGKFVVPGLVMLRTRVKPAVKAGKKEVFGKMCLVKAGKKEVFGK